MTPPTSLPQVGDVLPTIEVSITRADLIRYAGASLDFNPIHWNERFAKAVGLPDVIAHGMLTMAIAARVASDFGGDLVDYSARFTRPVVVPDDDTGAELTVDARVKGIEDGIAAIELTVPSEGEKVLAQARARVRL